MLKTIELVVAALGQPGELARALLGALEYGTLMLRRSPDVVRLFDQSSTLVAGVVFDEPKLVDDGLVHVLDLLPVNVRLVFETEAAVSKRGDAFCAPRTPRTLIFVDPLATPSCASHNMSGCRRVDVRTIGPIHHLAVEHRPSALVRVLVSPQCQIHAMLVEESLEGKEASAQHGKSFAHVAVVLGAVVPVQVAAIHGSVRHGDEPGSFGSVDGRKVFL
mmetsp:Transcript_26704/g.52626  ORF Transcript_26704/g.52626 Transcript_26704/m.52626 type:complete len:219 (+) Transcript_26704:126-782(+)